MLMKAKIEAARGLCLATAVYADLARLSANPLDRDTARMREDLLTPLAKAWSTDMAVEVASMGLQIHGGMGFIEETGAAQHYRDARILPIYEGTNGIQAIDLMGRKLAIGKGQAVRELVSDMVTTAAALKSADDAWLHTIGAQAGGRPRRRAIRHGLADRAPRPCPARRPRRRHALPQAARRRGRRLDAGQGRAWPPRKRWPPAKAPPTYWRTKIGLARVFSEQILSGAPALAGAVSQGAIDLFRATPESLGA